MLIILDDAHFLFPFCIAPDEPHGYQPITVSQSSFNLHVPSFQMTINCLYCHLLGTMDENYMR